MMNVPDYHVSFGKGDFIIFDEIPISTIELSKGRFQTFPDIYLNNIVAAVRGMHVSPAKNSYSWLPRKSDYQSVTPDRQTDGQIGAKMCRLHCRRQNKYFSDECAFYARLLKKICWIFLFFGSLSHCSLFSQVLMFLLRCNGQYHHCCVVNLCNLLCRGAVGFLFPISWFSFFYTL